MKCSVGKGETFLSAIPWLLSLSRRASFLAHGKRAKSGQWTISACTHILFLRHLFYEYDGKTSRFFTHSDVLELFNIPTSVPPPVIFKCRTYTVAEEVIGFTYI